MKMWARLRGRGVKTGKRNISNLRYADDTTLLAESSNYLKWLDNGEKESARVGLHLNIKKTKKND